MRATQPKDVRRIGSCFTAAALLEVCIEPSPGLVNPKDSGAHKDMNLSTFMLGTSVLAPYFCSFVETGWEYRRMPATELFASLRDLGIWAESELMEATDSVNTQRGQLFAMGLGAGLTGYCVGRGESVPSPEFFEAVRQACAGLCEREMVHPDPAGAANSTTGVRLYREYGITGARGEAEAGFPTVERTGYPAFSEGLSKGLSLNDAAVNALLRIMAVVDDTTVLGRLGMEGLITMRRKSREILEAGSVFTQDGRRGILETHNVFSSMGLSPGGAADLLALSMALYFVAHGLPRRETIVAPSLFERNP